MTEKTYNFYFFYNEKELCFYLENKTTKFEELYDKNKAVHYNEDSFEVELGENVYLFKNPKKIEFLFPDGLKKDIFISIIYHATFILNKYKDHDFFYIKEKGKQFTQFKLSEFNEIYPVSKIKIENKNFQQIINSNNRRVVDYENLTLKDLAFSHYKYLEHSNIIEKEKKENFFNLTEKRKKFFQLLDTELKRNSIIAIAGPEGIGKTTSILAYCKIKIKFYYFYFNAKTFMRLILESNNQEIKQLLIEELSHTLNKDNINEIVGKIIKKEHYKNSINFLIKIIEELDNLFILVIDQYKTSFDEKYNYLQQLINLFSSKFKIIILSSMNEDDVKDSIMKGITNVIPTPRNFYLNYIYVGELAGISKEQYESLNIEEKEILDSFGNLYSIYYKLLEFKQKFEIFDRNKFQEIISNEIQNNLSLYFKNKQEYEIYFMIIDLINISLDSFTKTIFLEKYNILPFRYIKFIVDGQDIFKISDISNNQDYKFEYLYSIMYKILFNIQCKIVSKLENNSNLLDNIKKAIQPLNLEKTFFLYLLGQKKFDKILIKKIIKIDSIYSPSKEDFEALKKDTENQNINDGILITQNSVKALSFDFGILVKISKSEFKFYLIQVTKKKDYQERITLNSLNDYFGFFKGLYKIKSNILISNDYFCYVFEEESKDKNSIKYCKENNIDYLTFSPKSFKINNDQEYELKEYFMKRKIIINDNIKINEENEIKLSIDDEIKIEKFFPKLINITKTYDFLKNKRKLIIDKEWNKIEEIQAEINKKNEYYNNISKNFKNIKIKKATNYNDQEEEIRKYLLGNDEFKDCNLSGIKYLVPNQNDLLEQLKQRGLSEKEIKNFYELIKINNTNYFIFNIKFYKYFIPYINLPEYMTYILMVSKDKENENYYLDYINYKKIGLNNKNPEDFKNVLMDSYIYIAVTFISKILAIESTDIINNSMDLEEEIDKKMKIKKIKKEKRKNKMK